MDVLHTILGHDIKAGLLVILNLVVIESLLSVDNAAVLATMVIDLPKEQRSRALKYGIIGAYVMRGLCLFLAAWLVTIWWLKPLGGGYLLYLAFDYFRPKKTENDKGGEVNKNKSLVYRSTVGFMGNFWATVALVEVMDLAFSIDNVFAAVAFTNHVYLIYIGVFIGILAMRFVAQAFVKLIEKFPFLEKVAFIVIGVLGIKLFASLYAHITPGSPVTLALESKATDIFISVFTVAVFLLPVLSSIIFNFPKRHTSHSELTDQAEEVLNKS